MKQRKTIVGIVGMVVLIGGLGVSVYGSSEEGKGTPTAGDVTCIVTEPCSSADDTCALTCTQPVDCPDPAQSPCLAGTRVWTEGGTCAADPTGGGGYICQ